VAKPEGFRGYPARRRGGDLKKPSARPAVVRGKKPRVFSLIRPGASPG